MQTVTTIGLDIAKSVFQVHGVDAAGQVIIRRQLKRRYVLAFFQKLSSCLISIEACASSHHWSRELQATWSHRAVDAAGLREALRQGSSRCCGSTADLYTKAAPPALRIFDHQCKTTFATQSAISDIRDATICSVAPKHRVRRGSYENPHPRSR
jgi:hypothetical protein